MAAWGVPAGLATLQTYLLDSPDDCGHSWWRAALREGLPWAVWAAATPFVLRSAGRPDVRRRIGHHIAAMLAIALAFGVANGTIGYLVRAGPPNMTFAGQLEMSIVDWLPISPVVYAGVLAVGLVLDGARRRRVDELARARLEGELATAKLAALRAQIQPHFLFNTLNAAVALARAGDNDGCARVLVLLGELLHQLLRDEAPQEVPLHEELALVERYLEIQRVRFGERLVVDWSIDDSVRDALVPQLVLQPLVENAFRHGLSRRSVAGKLDISATRVGDDLRLTVHDDGPGPAPAFELGVGLRNTGERLRRLYGDRGLVRLTGGNDGATAAVTLPLHTEVA
ncbi:MAG TPA: histidine kinase [Kofleriaceae bacterium]|nr:histidine kinase [Kofleriaceae bacterium]